ncbi:MAG: IS200/IS605 family element transposase accessory protein TnpB, partial [Comamonadaceae bacterium]|nr:IS200/IS605 family element transposase accessory protein TnpB [Comamonadaceae bacterium]
YRKGADKLAKLQKMRSRCRRGSNRYAELSRQVRVHHETMANRRLDFQHKLSTQLVSQYDVIFVERLNTNGLCRSHVSKSMYDAAWSQFLFFLQYKAERAGGARPEVDARGTSQECPACGAAVHKELSDRVHVCPSCRYTVPRDVAAAQVVEIRGATGWTDPLRKVILSWGEVAGSRSLQ